MIDSSIGQAHWPPVTGSGHAMAEEMPLSDPNSARGSSVHRPPLPTATIVRRRDWTEDLFQIWLRPDVPFPFAAGQYITIGAGGIERPYSIVSAPYEPEIELFIEYVLPEHGGKLTPLLYAQRVGDVVTMRPRAKGLFTLRPGVVNHVMVATVTGIAPYMSMIRQFLHDREAGTATPGPVRFFVLQGASHQDEFVYDAELRQLSAEHPDIVQPVFSVSRPASERNAGWSGPTGRINLLVEDQLERWQLRKEETLVYLCGNPGMIDDARDRLAPKGWPVLAEQYWTA
jgi:ferredoxin-NADP reductase